MINTNIFGLVNITKAILPLMALRQTDTVAVMSSLSGFYSMANSPGYDLAKLRFCLAAKAYE